ncbi:MAG: restriction endonuclease subunit S [Methanoregula sp.]
MKGKKNVSTPQSNLFDELELPEGWALTKIRDLVTINYGKGLKNANRAGGSVSVYGSNGIVGSHNKSLTDRPSIIIGRKGSIGEVHYSSNPSWPIDTTYYIDMFEGIDPIFLVFALKSLNLSDLDTSTAIPGLNRNDIYEQEIPLPPLVEQQRIVARVEALLTQVNAARERLNRVPLIMKKFRQAVLAAACSGRLTEEWREEKFGDNGIKSDNQSEYSSILPYNFEMMDELPKGWASKNLDGTANCRLGKMLDKIKNQGTLTPYIRNVNVRWFGFDLSDTKEIKIEDYEKDTYSLRSGDVLICEGGEPGRCAIWNENGKNYIFQKALHRVRVSDKLLPEFLCYCLKDASESGYLSDLFTGTTIKHLTGISLKKFPVPLPPLAEQHEIVRRVGLLFERADAIDREVAAAGRRCERLTQAVLGKAFRGELR